MLTPEQLTQIGTLLGVAFSTFANLSNNRAQKREFAKQTMNGDGRSLRVALDDLQFSVSEHHAEVTNRLDSIDERLTTAEYQINVRGSINTH